jgi:hypothetical protein
MPNCSPIESCAMLGVGNQHVMLPIALTPVVCARSMGLRRSLSPTARFAPHGGLERAPQRLTCILCASTAGADQVSIDLKSIPETWLRACSSFFELESASISTGSSA